MYAFGFDFQFYKKARKYYEKVLIVDDSPMVLNIIETALSLEDYDVVRASNADEALKKIEEGKFDFGIFDVNMPGKTGIELVPLVLNHPNGKSMKIVILTTESSAEIRKKEKTQEHLPGW